MRRKLLAQAMVVLLFSCLGASGEINQMAEGKGEGSMSVAPATRDVQGFLVHVVKCEYQAGETKLRVLLPDKLEPGKRYRTLYILSVEPGDPTRWGDGLADAKKTGLHNRYGGLICAFPTFSHWPWFADHPTDPGIRQESYFLKVIIPFVEKEYPALAASEGRLLVGFSKSGWGAFSLILRHPDVFGKAAAWDAPLGKNAPNVWEMGDIFKTQVNFEQYEITRLLNKQADVFRKPPPRLILMGYGMFKEHVEKTHDLLVQLGIPHEYQPEPQREHRWDSGWIGPAVELLMKE